MPRPDYPVSSLKKMTTDAITCQLPFFTVALGNARQIGYKRPRVIWSSYQQIIKDGSKHAENEKDAK